MSKIKHRIGARCTIFTKIIHNITLNAFNNNGAQVIFCRTLFWRRKYKINYATEFSCWKKLFVAYLQIWFRQCSPWHFKVLKLSLNSWNDYLSCRSIHFIKKFSLKWINNDGIAAEFSWLRGILSATVNSWLKLSALGFS